MYGFEGPAPASNDIFSNIDWDEVYDGGIVQQHQDPHLPGTADPVNLLNDDEVPVVSHQDNQLFGENEYGYESAGQANLAQSDQQQRTTQMFESARAACVDGLLGYQPPLQAPVLSTQSFSADGASSLGNGIFTMDFGSGARQDRARLHRYASAPTMYNGGCGEGMQSFPAFKRWQTVPELTGEAPEGAQGPSPNARPAGQPAQHAPLPQVASPPTLAQEDLCRQYMRQGRTGLTPSPRAQEHVLGIANPAGFSRTKAAGKRPAKPQPSGAGRLKEKFQCVDCRNLGRENWYCHTQSTGSTLGHERCRKHHAKWLKEQASTGPPVYRFDVEIPSFENAKIQVYPTIRPLVYEGDGEDDYVIFKDAEDNWIENFIRAANTEYTDETAEYKPPRDDDKQREHEHLLKQQETYNHKPHEKSSKESYTNDFINIRMRFLFRAVLTYHQGGPAIYPVGGANGGYGEDTTLSMSERLEQIEEILTKEKRVVMDVIEGRGVLALAANPKHYMERKQSNNKCNTKKKGKFAIADMFEARDMPTPGTVYGGDGGPGQSERYATPTPKPVGGKGKRKARVQGQRASSSKRQTRASGLVEYTPGVEQHEEELKGLAANATYSGGESSALASGYFAPTGRRSPDEHHGVDDKNTDTSWLQPQRGTHENSERVNVNAGSEWQNLEPPSMLAAPAFAETGVPDGLPPQRTMTAPWQLPEFPIDPALTKVDTTRGSSAGEGHATSDGFEQGEGWTFL